eukprot:1191404-Prorocentrum_minimum.AAC.1
MIVRSLLLELSNSSEQRSLAFQILEHTSICSDACGDASAAHTALCHRMRPSVWSRTGKESSTCRRCVLDSSGLTDGVGCGWHSGNTGCLGRDDTSSLPLLFRCPSAHTSGARVFAVAHRGRAAADASRGGEAGGDSDAGVQHAGLAGGWGGREAIAHVSNASTRVLNGLNGFNTQVTLLRVNPVVPFSASNYVMGLTELKLAPFAAGTVLGLAPWMAFYVEIGSTGRGLLRSGKDVSSVISGTC